MAGTTSSTPAGRRKYGQEWGVSVYVGSAQDIPIITVWTIRRDMSCFGNGPWTTTGSWLFAGGAW